MRFSHHKRIPLVLDSHRLFLDGFVVDVPEEVSFEFVVVEEFVVFDQVNFVVVLEMEVGVLSLFGGAEEDDAVPSVLGQDLLG